MRTHALCLSRGGEPGTRTLLERNPLRRPSKGARGAGKNNGAGAALVSKRRGSLLERLDRWLWSLQQRDIEAYLAQATDVFDLEARMHALARGAPHPYY
jgi:hypothetical protein